MVCPNCQSNMSDKRKRCERCGTDLTLYKKILKTSNLYYNDGLSRAKIRDLSGAIVALKKSLELNKLNTNARNLLGLIYFEMGETVAALSEWVISKHFQSTDNDADEYINEVQSNPTKLENLNQAIKRYNNALTFAKQGSDDLAIIQLKKVISLNPHFIRAFQLLALLHMKSGDNEHAKRYLMKAVKIDVSNTTTLRYMKELDTSGTTQKDADGNPESEKSITSSIMPISSYKEDKPNVIAYVNLVIGVVIGLAVCAILVIPSLKKNQTTGDNSDYVDYSAGVVTLEEKEQTIKSLQQENKDLAKEKKQLQDQINSIQAEDPALYDPLFSAAQLYLEELGKKKENRDLKQIAEALLPIDASKYKSEISVQLYNRLKEEIFPTVAEEYYEDGHNSYGKYKYEDALEKLQKAYALDPEDVDAPYFIGRTYDRMEDYENAAVYYNIVITDFPDATERVYYAKDFLKAAQDKMKDQDEDTEQDQNQD